VNQRKLYLDTSVISHLEQTEKPAEQSDCIELFERIKRGEYDVYISHVTMREIDDCSEPLRGILQCHLDSIKYTAIDETEEVLNFADKLIDAGVLSKRNVDDCRHIAAAVTAKCDIIVSLNFRHIVNPKTSKGVRTVCFNEGYKIIDIYSPKSIVEEDNDNAV
jgi:predicted nucleic acid-binding protein